MLRIFSIVCAVAVIIAPFLGVDDIRSLGLFLAWAILTVGAEVVAKIEAASAELRGLTNRRVMELSRTDAERAAGMVS